MPGSCQNVKVKLSALIDKLSTAHKNFYLSDIAFIFPLAHVRVSQSIDAIGGKKLPFAGLSGLLISPVMG
jgi:hypothetical protein